jgi:glycosyltransferase involved in cell wall biosynthesis
VGAATRRIRTNIGAYDGDPNRIVRKGSRNAYVQAMHVCLVSATFPPDVCGVGDQTFQLALALRRAGVQVTVLTSDRGSSNGPSQAPAGIVVKRAVASWTLRRLPTLVRTLRAGGYDLVHMQYTSNLYGRRTLAVNLLPYLLARPLFVTVNEFYSPMSRGLRNVVGGLYDRVKDTLLIWGSTAVIVTIPSRASRLSGLFPWLGRRIHTIASSANLLPDGGLPDERARTRSLLGIGPDELVIGSFGLLHTDRRYELLFRVVRRLLDQGHRLRLLLIGSYGHDDPYYRYLVQCVTNLRLGPHVTWTGFGSPPEISRWLLASDLYAMTDLRGASGRKSSLMSALAHGLPVVSTQGPDTERVFVESDGIVLIDPHDEEDSLVRHIDRLLKDGEERGRLAGRARQLYQSGFGWDRTAQRHIEVYRQHLPGERPAAPSVPV